MKSIFFLTAIIIAISTLNLVFSKEPVDVLRELKTHGLGDKHPRVIELNSLIQQGIRHDDQRLREFEKLLDILNAEASDAGVNDYKTTIYGVEIQARGMYISPKKLADRDIEEQLLQALYQKLITPEVRPHILAIHPTKHGVLVIVKPPFYSDLHKLVLNLNSAYITRGTNSISELYQDVIQR